ncbi:MAG: succinate dehydrogenase, cytochrome b556 subunit [Gammaproteobacteria bacterium]|nr:succinate dehydrogenase, cytochrome b556 subunit [Gammaproteobacteria bacterium]|tara:strand:+ start:448 stop:831 length:384 start_codon:yes stop_codon:yes gene_type:complete
MTITKRPLSPHLQIYKPQLTSVLSISHRITGVLLSLFSAMIPITLFFIYLGESYFLELKIFFNHIFIKFILVSFIFVLFYHFANGIRHLFWDMGIGLSLRQSYYSGYLVILFSIFSTYFYVFLFEGF